MIKIGLTGGIGSGKSTVALLMEVMDIPVYYADTVAKCLMCSDEELKNKIIALIGSKAYEGARLNRKYIAEKVFNKRSLLTQLNNIVHPVVRDDFNNWCHQFSNKHIVVQEAAVLFENGSYHYFDKTILVTAPELIRIQRVVRRDGTSEKAVRERIANQWTDDKKMQLANYVISNVDEKMLIVQLTEILKGL